MGMRMMQPGCARRPKRSKRKKLFSIKTVLAKLSPVFLLTFAMASLIQPSLGQDSTVCTISGYILDANGNGIKGAQIIFNVPDIVRSVLSDHTGYYAVYAPPGTYHLNVWPPWDSNYINYDEQNFVVTSDTTKSITLTQGYKITGYIKDTAGNPVKDAVVGLNEYLSGWWSNYQGYYFVNAPPGTYKFTVNPRSGAHHFVIISEPNFSLQGNIAKNVTVTLTDASTTTPSTSPGPFKISGFILDQNQKGVGGAHIIFGLPDVVPSVYSDSTGYYSIIAPAGSYHVNVWPPYDSNLINYDQPTLVVTSDLTKNITLNTGYKLSGYITSTTGEPVKNGIVSLNGLLSGWFSKDTGYYFVSAPAGTYTITANPRSGDNHFLIYHEPNFVLDQNKMKNITVVLTGSLTPVPSPTPEPNPTPLPDQAWISISVEATSSTIGSTINIKGRLTDYEERPLANQQVQLSYADSNSLITWTHIGSGTTTTTGEYNIQWKVPSAGNYLLKVEWLSNDNFPHAFNTTSVAFLPNDGNNSLRVESDSTVSQQTYATEINQYIADNGNWIWIVGAAAIFAVIAVGLIAMRARKKKH